jgi:hypothetical protein
METELLVPLALIIGVALILAVRHCYNKSKRLASDIE